MTHTRVSRALKWMVRFGGSSLRQQTSFAARPGTGRGPRQPLAPVDLVAQIYALVAALLPAHRHQRHADQVFASDAGCRRAGGSPTISRHFTGARRSAAATSWSSTPPVSLRASAGRHGGDVPQSS